MKIRAKKYRKMVSSHPKAVYKRQQSNLRKYKPAADTYRTKQ